MDVSQKLSIAGLGKTIQTLGFLSTLVQGNGYESQPRKSFTTNVHGPYLLVLCPLSVIATWTQEVAHYWPSCSVVHYSGAKDERTKIRERLLGPRSSKLGREFSQFGCQDHSKFDGIAEESDICQSERLAERFHHSKDCPKSPQFDLLIVSYETFLRDSIALLKLPWTCLVVDEAHRLKSRESQLYNVLFDSRLGTPQVFKILLTGTPLQNNMRVGSHSTDLIILILSHFNHHLPPLHFVSSHAAANKSLPMFRNSGPFSISFSLLYFRMSTPHSRPWRESDVLTILLGCWCPNWSNW